MRIGPRGKVLLTAVDMVLFAFFLLVALLKLNSPEPKTGIEAHFAEVIDQAEISDQFDWDGGGWDSADVSDKVCGRVDVAALQSLGMSGKPIWPMPSDGASSRATYVYQLTEDKSWSAACQDHSVRQLRIEIDAETLVCKATVMPMPTCDM